MLPTKYNPPHDYADRYFGDSAAAARRTPSPRKPLIFQPVRDDTVDP